MKLEELMIRDRLQVLIQNHDLLYGFTGSRHLLI